MTEVNEQPTYVWDTYEVAKHHAEFLIESGEETDEDRAFERACRDPDLMVWEWEYLLDALTETLTEMNPGGRWHGEVRNFGWRNQNGSTDFVARDAKTFLRKILPDTDCTFRIFIDPDKTIRIQNFHHDSPVGNEWYTITAATDERSIAA